MVEPLTPPTKRPFSDISDSDSEWEYEYSTTETEVFIGPAFMPSCTTLTTPVLLRNP